MKVFISPPFGNFVPLLSIKNVIPILGSYTIFPRKGLVGQVCRTYRYNREQQGWVNRIGLRNKGLAAGMEQYKKYSKNGPAVLSIGLVEPDDIQFVEKVLPLDIEIEINISAPSLNATPNIDEYISLGLSNIISQERKYNIIKLPHAVSMNTVDKLYECGFRQFHCSNTKLTAGGELSGPALRQKNLATIEEMSRRFCGEIEIIGGGGIQNIDHIEQYRWVGAEHISLGTVCMNPYNLYKILNVIQ